MVLVLYMNSFSMYRDMFAALLGGGDYFVVLYKENICFW
jgi:hypothetical protein